MSSPVHHPEDLDAALMYAPPWARKANAPAATPATAADSESPPTSPGGENDEPPFIGDRAMLTLRRRLSFDPEIVPAPPIAIEKGLPLEQIALRLCAVAFVAALVAWAVTSLVPGGSAEKEIVHAATVSQPGPEAHQTVRVATVPELAAKPVRLIHLHAATQTPQASPAMQAPPALPAVLVAENEPSSQPASLQLPAREAAAQHPVGPPSVGEALTLSSDEIATLVKRGKDHLMDGDISSARLLLRPAAEAGNAEAALALGSTFDPNFIHRLGAIGVNTDAAKARKWYGKAAELGSNVASEQLARLGEAAR